MPGERGLVEMRVGENELSFKNKAFFESFGKMVLSTRQGGQWNNQYEPGLLQKVLKDNSVTCKELHDAFYKAYSDHFTPQTGVEWRHLFKHIEKSRHGSGDKFYTYNEMLHICHKESITTDHFDFIEKDKFKRK